MNENNKTIYIKNVWKPIFLNRQTITKKIYFVILYTLIMKIILSCQRCETMNFSLTNSK